MKMLDKGRAYLARRRRYAGVGALALCAAAGLAAAQADAPIAPFGQPATMAPVGDDTYGVTTTLPGILQAARAGDGTRLEAAYAGAGDPSLRRLALFELADVAPDYLNWSQADEARRTLADWPRPAHRQAAAEKLLDRAGLPPASVISWFGQVEPVTGQGAMALASALIASGRPEPAASVIRKAWRTLAFDDVTQANILYRFHGVLTPADIAAREDFLLYSAQGPAAQALLPQLPADQQAIAQVRMALRRNDPNAPMMLAALPVDAQTSAGVVYERLLPLVQRQEIGAALDLYRFMPLELPNQPAAEKLWAKGALFKAVMRAGDYQGAYLIAAHSGLTTGAEAAEAQFDAGWLALTKLNQPKLAEDHFARIQVAGSSPLTQSRALYWRGRAAEAEGDALAAQLYFGQAAKHNTTFYGQLAATRGGGANLVLGHDPDISPSDRDRFEQRDYVKVARALYASGDHSAFKTFVAGLSESVPSVADEALLVDLTRNMGDQELSMRVVRNAAKRGFILPDRGYPVRTVNIGYNMAEAPLVLGVTRQESSFDPAAHSGAGARGMMQLMPATASIVARRAGLGYGSLDDPDYNMRVGSTYLRQLVDQFSGSYVLAAAAYNAGPGRPTQWVVSCGDPRNAGTDPLDFIECIPFSETRDYVMRVLEATQVYRAKLNGGAVPITLAADLKRGGYGYAAQPSTALVSAPGYMPPAH